jgi:hypothetical protein
MPTAIELPMALYEAMVQQLLGAYPLEACGIMAGPGGRIAFTGCIR